MRKKFSFPILVVLITAAIFYPGFADMNDLRKFGKLVAFNLIDDLGDPRNVQVFIPRSYSYETPAKVAWYFRGLNGIYTTWNIETTKLYKTGYEERAIIVAPALYQKTWSKDDFETDYYLVNDIIEKLKTLKDDQQRNLNLDLENMSAIGFSAGGGFIYRLAGKYPLMFNQFVFRKFISHAKHIDVILQPDGSFTGNIKTINDLKAAYSLFPDDKPPFLLSVGDADHTAGNKALLMINTKEVLEKIGFTAYLYIVPGMHHQFDMDYSPDFKKWIEDFLFPIRVTYPNAGTEWLFTPGEEFTIRWTAELPQDKPVTIDLFSCTENKYEEIGHSDSGTGSYTVILSHHSFKAGTFFVRIKADDNMDVAYSAAFKIVSDPIEMRLQAAWKEEKAWIIKRCYGDITLSAAHVPVSAVSEFAVYRKETNGAFELVKEIPVENLQNGSYTFPDKYLESGKSYIYQAKAYGLNGELLAVSAELLLLPGNTAAADNLARIPGAVQNRRIDR